MEKKLTLMKNNIMVKIQIEISDLFITVNIQCKEGKAMFLNIFYLFNLKTDSYNRIQYLVTLPLHSYPKFGFFLMKKRSQQNKMPPLNHFATFCVKNVMGNAHIKGKVTVLPEHLFTWFMAHSST